MLVHGVNDTRVDVWQSAKFASRLAAVQGEGKPVLMRLDYDLGHGGGGTRTQQQAQSADIWSFFLGSSECRSFSRNSSLIPNSIAGARVRPKLRVRSSRARLHRVPGEDQKPGSLTRAPASVAVARAPDARALQKAAAEARATGFRAAALRCSANQSLVLHHRPPVQAQGATPAQTLEEEPTRQFRTTWKKAVPGAALAARAH